MPYGTVKEIGKKYAIVQVERQEMCGECHACDYVYGKKACSLRCEMDIECQKGDVVELLLAQSSFLKATYLMYGIPLLGFVLGMISGYGLNGLLLVGREDLMVFSFAILGTGIGLLAVRWGESKGKFRKYLPRIIGTYKKTAKS